MKKAFTLFAAMALLTMSYAQLPNESIAQDFELYEINKTTGQMITDQTINLYSMLNDYKTVYIDVSASTCGPCQTFHNTGTLETLWSNYGPNSSVNDTRILFIEGASTGATWESLTGQGYQGTSTWNVVAGVEYPVIPLYFSPNYPSNYNSFHSNYNIHYFPTIYMVCPNRMVYELDWSSSQNNATAFRNEQLAKCPAINNTNDAILGERTFLDAIYYCGYDFAPQVLIQNVGSATMTSATLRATLGSDVQTYNWTGNLAQFQTEMVTLPSFSGSANGTQTLTIEIVDVNGVPDEGSMKNTHTETFLAQATPDVETASQNFSSSNLSSWIIKDLSDGYCYVYQGALLFNAYSASSGTTAELYAPYMDFSNLTTPKISFDLCYKRYNNSSNDKLQIMVSTDCGNTWTAVFNKSGADLATGANTTSNYVAAASDYQTQVVDLADFASSEGVIIKFVFTSGYGNNIWVDNVNIFDGETSIDVVDNSSLQIFPNPVKDVLNINYDNAINQIDVYDVNGKMVKTLTAVGGTINVSDLSSGVYMLNIQTEEGLVVRKIVKE